MEAGAGIYREESCLNVADCVIQLINSKDFWEELRAGFAHNPDATWTHDDVLREVRIVVETHMQGFQINDIHRVAMVVCNRLVPPLETSLPVKNYRARYFIDAMNIGKRMLTKALSPAH